MYPRLQDVYAFIKLYRYTNNEKLSLAFSHNISAHQGQLDLPSFLQSLLR